jgi:DNA-directed RNA polymerase subunit RPC12/RpoP
MAGKRSRRRRREGSHEASYVCQSCGEEIVVPLDRTAGRSQQYVEDCPVCCHPQLLTVEFDDDGEVRIWSESE